MDVSPSDGGTVQIEQTAPSSYPVTSTFSNGVSIRVEAIPASGYLFSNWSGDLVGATNPTTIVIDCNKEITANFSQIMHTLTMQVSGGGSITPAAGNHSYGEGIVVSITATPDSGWQFDSWNGDVADPDLANTTVAMASDKTVTANFSQVKPGWWFIGGIIAAGIIIGVIIWLAVRRRTA